MTTTVPQNIKGSRIAGRHTPTRNSLRHSRMLVINNKNYQGMEPSNPMNFLHPNFARWMLILQTIIGSLISFLSVWIFFLSPSTAIQDNPYWNGLALLLAGTVGLVLIRYERIKRHKVREHCFRFLRADSYLLSLATMLLCVVALLCATIHFIRLTASDTHCESANILMEHGSCSCTFNAPAMKELNLTEYDLGAAPSNSSTAPQPEIDHSYTVEYRDLSCQEVRGVWTYLLGSSVVLNALGFIVSLLYLVMLASCRQGDKRDYANVHTSVF